jgi:predicted nuclease of restriction endonuclease-like RecB superfamily
MNLLVELPDEEASELRKVADRLGIGLEQLARAALADLAGKQAADFEAATARVLVKNAELYRRLA